MGMGLLLCLGIVALLLFGGPGDALPPGEGKSPSQTHNNPFSSHFLSYFYTAVSEPGEGLPWFMIVGSVDGQPISRYDSNTRMKARLVPWMKKVEETDPTYWEQGTEISRNTEKFFRESLEIARNRYNQSEGFHTLQWLYGCELRKDGSKGGYWQYGYDGRDYIHFDKETLTWTAADVTAQKTKRKWEAEPLIAQYWKAYLEEECIEWLQRYLEYGKETLLRTEAPKVKVTRKTDYDNMETLICRVDGFYPKDIDINWRRDGEVWMSDTFRGLVSRNSDGTYYTWLSVKIDPKDREHYKCHVEHDGLLNHVDLAWEEPAFSLWFIIGCVMVAVLLVVMIAGTAVYFKKRQDGYKAASKNSQVSDCSTKELLT